MLNRTLVDGVSASQLPHLQTKRLSTDGATSTPEDLTKKSKRRSTRPVA
jgi:hypothetical protein